MECLAISCAGRPASKLGKKKTIENVWKEDTQKQNNQTAIPFKLGQSDFFFFLLNCQLNHLIRAEGSPLLDTLHCPAMSRDVPKCLTKVFLNPAGSKSENIFSANKSLPCRYLFFLQCRYCGPVPSGTLGRTHMLSYPATFATRA